MKVLTLALLCIAALLGCTRSRPPIEPAMAAAGSGSPKAAGTMSAPTAGSRPGLPTSQRDGGATMCAPDGDCAQPGTAGAASTPPKPQDAGSGVPVPEPVCGNGVIEVGEQCELICTQGATPSCTAKLSFSGCQSLGFTSGVLGCASCQVDTRGCGKCGDGRVQEGEDCDGTDFQGMSCVGLGFGQGTLNCEPSSCLFDTSMCIPFPCFRTRLPCRSGGF